MPTITIEVPAVAGRKAEFLKLASEMYDRAVSEDQEQLVTFDQIEDRALAVGGEMQRHLVRELLGGRERGGETVCCPRCKGEVRALAGPRRRKLRGRTGEIEFGRRECYCPSCRKAFFPSGQRAGAGR